MYNCCTWDEFHNNHNRLFLYADPNKTNNIRMVILLEDSTFAEELLFLLLRQIHTTRLHSDI